MALNLIRKSVSGKGTFAFEVPTSSFIVKNFSSGDVLVAFKSDAVASESIKIPSQMGQICSNGGYGVDTVYVTGNGEVEVQQI